MRLVEGEAKLLPDEGQVEELAVIRDQQGEFFNFFSEAGQVLPLHIDARLLAVVQADHRDVGHPKRDPSGINVQVGDALPKLRVQTPVQRSEELLGQISVFPSLKTTQAALPIT